MAAFLLSAAIAPAYGATKVRISGNGSDSDNSVSLRSNSRTHVTQRNNADISSNIEISSNTGGNNADDNTDGNSSIDTGDVDTLVRVSNHANVNFLSFGHGNSGDNDSHDNDDEGRKSDRRLQASLNGEEEVPGPGDPDGDGHAKVRVHPKKGELCVRLHVSNIDTATAAHIHEGEDGVAGPVVVTLPTPNEDGFAKGCVEVDSDTLKEIKDNPSDYYVNIHNDAFPDGAIRGQLFR